MGVGSSLPFLGAPEPRAQVYAKRPLHPTTDSIRLITIEPSLNGDGLIVSHLNTATFAQRPKYEALSYRWGDESTQKKIILEDEEFFVGQNLWDALDYFRHHTRGLPLWIDAISINQFDIPERNRQVRIMPHIYTRANKVLVWLGARFSEYGPEADAIPSEQEVLSTGPDIYARLKAEIIRDGYWNRLWILQEIGKAQKIEVCFGDQAMEWNNFIHWIEPEAQRIEYRYSAVIGPVKLYIHLQSKYDGNYALKHLMRRHGGALCQDPRDKIYGLVGLSTDGRGIPVDYSKSVLDVWVDTVNYMHRYGLVGKSETLAIADLVRESLGADKLSPVRGLVQLHNARGDQSEHDSENWDKSRQFPLKFVAEVLGTIATVGPSTAEIVSSLEKTNEWEVELQRNYSNRERDDAHRQHDDLMRLILESHETVSPQINFVQHHRINFEGNYDLYDATKERVPKGSWLPGIAVAPAASTEPLLAQVVNPNGTTPQKLALVPPQAQVGDAICRFLGAEMKDIIVRQGAGNSFHVFGTAIMVQGTVSNERREHDPIKTQINLDPRTLYAILF